MEYEIYCLTVDEVVIKEADNLAYAVEVYDQLLPSMGEEHNYIAVVLYEIDENSNRLVEREWTAASPHE